MPAERVTDARRKGGGRPGARLTRSLGELAGDSRFATNAARVGNRIELRAAAEQSLA